MLSAVDLVSAVAGMKALVAAGEMIDDLLKRADAADGAGERLLHYLDAIDEAAGALRREREEILRAARRCDMGDQAAVRDLADRIDAYLDNYVVYPKLERAIAGMNASFETVCKLPRLLRRQDKAAAINGLAQTTARLNSLFNDLTCTFYRGSGMGLLTLRPIAQLLGGLERGPWAPALDADERERREDELNALVEAALDDDTHRQWIRAGGEIETLTEKVRCAFRVGPTKP
jgi:hypothetical protein